MTASTAKDLSSGFQQNQDENCNQAANNFNIARQAATFKKPELYADRAF